jgi:hypothetical protein
MLLILACLFYCLIDFCSIYYLISVICVSLLLSNIRLIYYPVLIMRISSLFTSFINETSLIGFKFTLLLLSKYEINETRFMSLSETNLNILVVSMFP